MESVEASWNRAWASYDSWRLASPPEPDYDWDDFVTFVEQNPNIGWDPHSDSDYEEYCEIRRQEDAEAKAERLADNAAEDRAADDEAYWDSL